MALHDIYSAVPEREARKPRGDKIKLQDSSQPIAREQLKKPRGVDGKMGLVEDRRESALRRMQVFYGRVRDWTKRDLLSLVGLVKMQDLQEHGGFPGNRGKTRTPSLPAAWDSIFSNAGTRVADEAPGVQTEIHTEVVT
jgi:hypothetical protein